MGQLFNFIGKMSRSSQAIIFIVVGIFCLGMFWAKASAKYELVDALAERQDKIEQTFDGVKDAVYDIQYSVVEIKGALGIPNGRRHGRRRPPTP